MRIEPPNEQTRRHHCMVVRQSLLQRNHMRYEVLWKGEKGDDQGSEASTAASSGLTEAQREQIALPRGEQVGQPDGAASL